MKLSPEDMIDYIKHQVESFGQPRQETSADEFKAYQRALQKLEAEVRTHIQVRPRQIEEQLKIYLDSVEAKLEKVERQRDKQLKEAESSINSLEKEKADLQKLLAQDQRRPSLQGKGEDGEALRMQVSRAKEYIKELEQKVLLHEAQLGTRTAANVDLDRRLEKEMEALRKKYDDKCSEMKSLIKRLNSLTAFKNKVISSKTLKESATESRDVSPMPSTSVLKQKIKSYKALNAKELTGTAGPSLIRRVIERSKSTERLQGKTSRASSRSRGGDLSSTVRR
jgi:chromosome segregation ATPase